jgi:hypothetical protein
METLRDERVVEVEGEGEANVSVVSHVVGDGGVGVGGKLSELGVGTGGVEREYGGQSTVLLAEPNVDEDSETLFDGVGQSNVLLAEAGGDGAVAVAEDEDALCEGVGVEEFSDVIDATGVEELFEAVLDVDFEGVGVAELWDVSEAAGVEELSGVSEATDVEELFEGVSDALDEGDSVDLVSDVSEASGTEELCEGVNVDADSVSVGFVKVSVLDVQGTP